MAQGVSYDWGDEGLKKTSTRESNWYKAKLGYTDVIRIVAGCDPVYRHNWQEAGRFRTSMCSAEDHGTCPYCDIGSTLHGHERQLTYGTTILHVSRAAPEGKPKLVGKILAWRFGDDKKRKLIEIHETTAGRLKKVDLRVRIDGTTTQDENYQKLIITPLSKNQLPDERVVKFLTAKDKDGKLIAANVKLLYHPTPDSLRQYLKQVQEAESFEPESFANEDEEDEKPKKKAKKKAKNEDELEEATEDEAEEDEPFDGGEDPLEGVL